MTSPDATFLDPFEAHAHREPLRNASVHVVVFHDASETGADERVRSVATSLIELLKRRGRACETDFAELSDASAWEGLASRTSLPLTLLTHARVPWTAEHLDPLLDAIDRCDHVIGRRHLGAARLARGWFTGAAWRWVFAVPVLDVHSPCRLHRTERLREIPLQSSSSFLDVEVLAKATFLGHLIDEVSVPTLDAIPRRFSLSDVRTVFQSPEFRHRPRPGSGPPEDSEGEDEGADGPDPHHHEGQPDVAEPRAFENDRAQRVEELREG